METLEKEPAFVRKAMWLNQFETREAGRVYAHFTLPDNEKPARSRVPRDFSGLLVRALSVEEHLRQPLADLPR
jgi:hypothetical protein